MENQTNIEEVIRQLEQSYNRFEEHLTKAVVVPSTVREVLNRDRIIVAPYIMREEKHITQKKIKEKTEREIKTMEIIEFVPYIQYKNGEILPY